MTRVFLLLPVFLLSGCSITAYTPVIGASVVGMDEVSTKDDDKYGGLIQRSIILESEGERIWTLRKFSGGRYFIELSRRDSNYTPLVCDLTRRELFITDIYEDRISGGVFYSANTSCADGSIIETSRNHWYEVLFDYSQQD